MNTHNIKAKVLNFLDKEKPSKNLAYKTLYTMDKNSQWTSLVILKAESNVSNPSLIYRLFNIFQVKISILIYLGNEKKTKHLSFEPLIDANII